MKNRSYILVFFFWVLFLGGIYVNNKSQNSVSLEFDVAIYSSSTLQNVGEFYFDTGNGFNEAETVKFNYYQETDGQFYPIKVIFPNQGLKQLRFDPLPAEGQIRLKNIIIKKYYPKKLLLLDKIKTLLPQNSIESVEVIDDQLSIVTNGADPFLIISQNISTFALADYKALINYVGLDKFVAGVLSLVLLSFLITWFTYERTTVTPRT